MSSILTGSRKRGRERKKGESYPLISLSLRYLALNNEAPTEITDTHQHTHITSATLIPHLYLELTCDLYHIIWIRKMHVNA